MNLTPITSVHVQGYIVGRGDKLIIELSTSNRNPNPITLSNVNRKCKSCPILQWAAAVKSAKNCFDKHLHQSQQF